MNQRQHTVMVVEDDESIRLTMKMFFEDEGYRVLVAEHGQEALDHLERMPSVCLIFLDLFMPVMDGAEFMEKLKQAGSHPAVSVPIVVVSASPPDGPMAVRVKPHAKHFLRKPASLDQLVELTQAYCPKS